MRILCTNGLKSVLTNLVPALERESGSKSALRWGAAASPIPSITEI
jgi:hypothetical protein